VKVSMAKDTSKMKLGNKQGRTPPSGVLNPGEQAINEMDFNMSLSSPGNGKDPAHAAQSTDHHSPALLKGNELRERPNIAQAMQELALHNKFETPVRELGRVRTISHAFEAEFDRLIARVSPNKEANKYRLQVYRYLEELLVECHAIEVVPFGSFALETYLPDGDIDICVFFQTNPSDHAREGDVSLRCLLEVERKLLSIIDHQSQTYDGAFQISHVHMVHAGVRVLKCFVGGIAVDISANQTRGICTLCFLNMVNEKIGDNELFKRSILAIKAWCYYESRILGSQSGLIATYALEVLVLYILNNFAETNTPCQVLQKFLDMFCEFSWENHLTIAGPVMREPGSSATQSQEKKRTFSRIDPHEMQEMLDKCKIQDLPPKEFVPKFVNLLDPLDEYNNLGRSVNKASFLRMRHALKLGASTMALAAAKEGTAGEESARKFLNATFRAAVGGRVHLDCPTSWQPDLKVRRDAKPDALFFDLKTQLILAGKARQLIFTQAFQVQNFRVPDQTLVVPSATDVLAMAAAGKKFPLAAYKEGIIYFQPHPVKELQSIQGDSEHSHMEGVKKAKDVAKALDLAIQKARKNGIISLERKTSGGKKGSSKKVEKVTSAGGKKGSSKKVEKVKKGTHSQDDNGDPQPDLKIDCTQHPQAVTYADPPADAESSEQMACAPNTMAAERTAAQAAPINSTVLTRQARSAHEVTACDSACAMPTLGNSLETKIAAEKPKRGNSRPGGGCSKHMANESEIKRVPQTARRPVVVPDIRRTGTVAEAEEATRRGQGRSCHSGMGGAHGFLKEAESQAKSSNGPSPQPSVKPAGTKKMPSGRKCS